MSKQSSTPSKYDSSPMPSQKLAAQDSSTSDAPVSTDGVAEPDISNLMGIQNTVKSQDEPPAPRCGWSDLPRELRDMILKYALCWPHTKAKYRTITYANSTSIRSYFPNGFIQRRYGPSLRAGHEERVLLGERAIALFLVSKRVRLEAMEVFYSLNTLSLFLVAGSQQPIFRAEHGYKRKRVQVTLNDPSSLRTRTTTVFSCRISSSPFDIRASTMRKFRSIRLYLDMDFMTSPEVILGNGALLTFLKLLADEEAPATDELPKKRLDLRLDMLNEFRSNREFEEVDTDEDTFESYGRCYSWENLFVGATKSNGFYRQTFLDILKVRDVRFSKTSVIRGRSSNGFLASLKEELRQQQVS